MEKNKKISQANDNGVFPICFFLGLIGFLITWQSGFDYSGIRGFLIGFLVPYALYILIGLLTGKEHITSQKTIRANADEVTIKEINKGRNVEINIIIPKSFLYPIDNV